MLLFHPHHCRLFEIAPELQELFPFEGQELTEENTLLKKHALQVMESVGGAISLMGNPEQLQDTLIELGIVHNMKSVQVKSFEVGLIATSVHINSRKEELYAQ